MKDDFFVLIQNRTEFENGNPAGVWLSLPATREELAEAMKALHITADNPQDFFLNGYSTEAGRRVEIPFEWVREANIDKLNFLAARLEEMTPAQLDKINAFMQTDFKLDSLDKLIDYTYNTDYFVYIPEVYTRSDLGDYYLNESGMMQMPEEWKAGIDKEDFGSNAALCENGRFTDYGYILKSGDEWKDVYAGKEVPEQYRIMHYPQPEHTSENKIDYDAAVPATSPPSVQKSVPVHPLELTATKPGEKLKEITDKLEQGIQDLFESDRFKNYLNVMSKFHNYSFSNTILIAMQKPDATFVAGYNSWKNSFQRQVLKGEKGIKVIAPSPYKVKREMEKIDPKTQKPIMGKDGKPMTEEVEVTIPAFKVVSVFDISQTEGRELPTIGVDELTGNVEKYPQFFKAVEQASPVPVGFEKIEGGAHGYYHLEDKRIAVNEGMSELQNLKTLIHEISHAKLHDVDLNAPAEQQADRVDRRTREVQAESIAYTVCQHYGLDTSDYSFAYVAGWSSGRELAELKASLETIRSTASELIAEIDRNFAELTKTVEQEKGALPEKETAADKDTYTIYQLKDNTPVDYHFRPLDELQEKGLTVTMTNYEAVYTAPIEPGTGLEDIYTKFNIDHPEDFKGHSLSVSDVVVLHQNGQDTAHYVDSYGFQKVPEFTQPENYLKAAEQSTEQNANMIDGQINNTPSVDELEAKVKAGEQISLIDLAEAIKNDKATAKSKPQKPGRKPSIRKQLKEDKKNAKKEPKKQAAKTKNKELEV